MQLAWGAGRGRLRAACGPVDPRPDERQCDTPTAAATPTEIFAHQVAISLIEPLDEAAFLAFLLIAEPDEALWLEVAGGV